MDRDFAYKDKTGKGVIQTKKNTLLAWNKRLLLIAFCLIVITIVLGYYLSNAIPELPLDSPVSANPQTSGNQQLHTTLKESVTIENKNKLSDITIDDTDQKLEPESDGLRFYELLREPLVNDYTSDNQIQGQVSYSVKSGLIRNKINARSVQALLVFEGFYNVKTDEVNWNGQQWYQLVIEPIDSRSKMNEVRDFLGSHDLDSEYFKLQ